MLSLGGITWWRVIPAHRPARPPGEQHGVDVSNHQGAIDWDSVAGDGITFAYIKATEGGDWIDEQFAANWDGAGDAGLDRGAYHFFTLCRPGADQADNFLRIVPADDESLPPAVDLELAGNCEARPAGADVRRELTTFLDRVEAATGKQAIFYMGDDFDEAFDIRANIVRPAWVASMLHRPPEPWVIWQTSWTARVDGISVGVDLDVMKG